VVYERSKQRGIRDEKQRHNDNYDRHNEISEFSHHLLESLKFTKKATLNL